MQKPKKKKKFNPLIRLKIVRVILYCIDIQLLFFRVKGIEKIHNLIYSLKSVPCQAWGSMV